MVLFLLDCWKSYFSRLLLYPGDLGGPADHVKGLVIGQDMARELLLAICNSPFAFRALFKIDQGVQDLLG